MSYKKILISGVSIVATSYMMLPQTAYAQDEGAFKIDEVVVTARKRTESLQDVPIAVTALDAGAIEKLHISTLDGIDKVLPNVDLGNSPFVGRGLNAVIRGIGFSDPEKTFEPTVGTSIDGVFLASSTGGAFDVFDLESVEVLRGPQGTLFGRNTVGGVINVTRSRPTLDAGLKLGTRISNNSGREFLGVANSGQIGGVLSTKVYAFKKDDDTFATNIVTGEKDKQRDSFEVGAAFLYEPNDQLEALVSIDYFNDDSQAGPTYNTSLFGSELFCTLGTVAFGGANVPNGVGCASGSIDVAEASDFDDFVRGTPFLTSFDGWAVTANIEYQLNENLTLTSITGYRDTTDQQLNDITHGPNVVSVNIPAPGPGFLLGVPDFPLIANNRVQDANQFSQELRLSGNVGDRFNFVSGLYYLNSKFDIGPGEFDDGVVGTLRGFNSPTPDITTSGQDAEALAAFIDGTFDITDRLTFSGGFRLSYEEKNFFQEFVFAGPIDLDGDGFPETPSPLTGQSVDETEDWLNPTWRAILQYDVSDDVNVYGGYSRGIRSGGFNGRGTTPTISQVPFDEETVDSFEIGARAELFGNRLRINPTAFYAKYDDKQEERLLATGDGTDIALIVDNASEVDIKGVELEVLARLTEELSVRGAFGYVDAEFVEFLDIVDGVEVDVSDERNLRSGPDTTLSFGANYSRPILNGALQLTLDANYSYQDGAITSAATDPLGLDRDRVGSNNSTDFSASISTLRSGANLTLTAFVNDAFDSAPGRNASQVFIPGVFGFAVGVPTTLYGLEATVEF